MFSVKGLKKQILNIFSYPSQYTGREDLFSNVGTKEMLRFKRCWSFLLLLLNQQFLFLFSCVCLLSPPHDVKYRCLSRITSFFLKDLKINALLQMLSAAHLVCLKKEKKETLKKNHAGTECTDANRACVLNIDLLFNTWISNMRCFYVSEGKLLWILKVDIWVSWSRKETKHSVLLILLYYPPLTEIIKRPKYHMHIAPYCFQHELQLYIYVMMSSFFPASEAQVLLESYLSHHQES